ncbi:MAG: alpha/beta fold hydrolase [Spirochaetes bacterium]|nr:alpha/beta fold hydrolase [Spirochaetota bacterium]
MKRKILWVGGILLVLFFAAGTFGLWSASSQLLFPAWRGITKDLAVCPAEAERHWGKHCGNLRQSGELKFEEIGFANAAGGQLPGWLIQTTKNGFGKSAGAILLVHGGGSDRREMTRFIRFYLAQKLDVLTFDYSCHGEAPCSVPGLSYGERESQDVVAAYDFLKGKYAHIYAMGSSVGAAAVLMALPQLDGIAGIIAENSPYSFSRLIFETPAAPKGMPVWFTQRLIVLSEWRGKFGSHSDAGKILAGTKSAKIFFIHSKADTIVPWHHAEQLAAAYNGPKALWLPEYGDHGAIWDAKPQEYERRVRDFLAE